MLNRERGKFSMSLGMAGAMQLPVVIPRDTIRKEGASLGYDGEDLEEFVEIISALDDYYVEVGTKQALGETKRMLDRTRNRTGR